MRGASRNCRCHHAKRYFKPFQPPERWAPGSSRISVRRSCHDDDRVIQPNNPSSVHFPDVPCGSLAPQIDVAYTSWLPGAKEESKGQGPFASSSVMRVTEEPQGSGLELQTGRAQELATCRGRAATPLGRRSGRQPDLIGAAQHPGIERCAVIPTTPAL